jgi:hypothetical protein
MEGTISKQRLSRSFLRTGTYMAGTIINEGFIAASLTLLSPICGKNDYQAKLHRSFLRSFNQYIRNDYQAETPSQLPQNFKYSQLQIGYLDQTQSDRFCRRHHVESNACWTVQQLMLSVVAVVV